MKESSIHRRLLSRLGSLFAIAAIALSAMGCQARSTYRIFPISAEAVADKLDGTWFERDVYDKDGIAEIELVYCPIVPKDKVVCRSSIVWQRNRSELLK
jgi:hypothetical protein